MTDDPIDEWSRHIDAFMFIVSIPPSPQGPIILIYFVKFVYFFIASSFTLILMNILSLTSRPKMTKGDRVRIVVYFILAIVLASLAATVSTDAGFAFAQSAWVLPTLL
jgi:hypothetical protein